MYLKRLIITVATLMLLLLALFHWTEFDALAQNATQTFRVNSTDDAEDGVCDAAHCSMREAIDLANVFPGKDTIVFDLPPLATIQPNKALPIIKTPLSLMAG